MSNTEDTFTAAERCDYLWARRDAICELLERSSDDPAAVESYGRTLAEFDATHELALYPPTA